MMRQKLSYTEKSFTFNAISMFGAY